jgi:hypothetical protein
MRCVVSLHVQARYEAQDQLKEEPDFKQQIRDIVKEELEKILK